MTENLKPPPWDDDEKNANETKSFRNNYQKLQRINLEKINLADEEAILVQCEALIAMFAWRYSGFLSVEDAAQSAACGVIKGVRSYDPARGVKLITWLYHAVRGEVQHANRDDTGDIFIPEAARINIQGKQKERELLESQGVIVDLDVTKNIHRRPSELPKLISWDDNEVQNKVADSNVFTTVDQQMSLEVAMVRLTPEEKLAIHLTVALEYTYKEAAEKFLELHGIRISQSMVHYLRKRGLKKLQTYFISKKIDQETMLKT